MKMSNVFITSMKIAFSQSYVSM